MQRNSNGPSCISLAHRSSLERRCRQFPPMWKQCQNHQPSQLSSRMCDSPCPSFRRIDSHWQTQQPSALWSSLLLTEHIMSHCALHMEIANMAAIKSTTSANVPYYRPKGPRRFLSLPKQYLRTRARSAMLPDIEKSHHQSRRLKCNSAARILGQEQPKERVILRMCRHRMCIFHNLSPRPN